MYVLCSAKCPAHAPSFIVFHYGLNGAQSKNKNSVISIYEKVHSPSSTRLVLPHCVYNPLAFLILLVNAIWDAVFQNQ
jgi:hypothetical protein